MNKVQYDEQAKQNELLFNKKREALHAKTMAEVTAGLNESFVSSNSLTEAEALYTAANAKYNEVFHDLENEAEYVHNKNNSLRARLSDDAPLRDKVNEILNARGYNIATQDWYDINLRNRDESNAFGNLVDTVFAAYDPETREWNDDKLTNNVNIDNYLDIAGFVQKNDD